MNSSPLSSRDRQLPAAPEGAAVIDTPRLRLVPMSLSFLERCLADDQGGAARELGLMPAAEWWAERWLMELRAGQLRQDPALAPWLLRALVRRADNVMVGHFNAHDRPGAAHIQHLSPRAIELGYVVYPSHRRQGYALEAIAGFLPFARAGGADLLVLSIPPDNAPSLALAQRLGCHHVGAAADEAGEVEWLFLRSLQDEG